MAPSRPPDARTGGIRGLSRNGVFWSALGTIAAVIGTATGIYLAIIGPDDPKDERPEATVTLGRSDELGNFVLATPSDELPAPPQYKPARAGNHCPSWKRWARNHAAAVHAFPPLRVSAPASAGAHVAALRVSIFRTYRPPDVTRIQCLYGAGGYAALVAHLRFDRPAAPVVVDDENAGVSIDVPPDGVRVARGNTETIILDVQGARPDRFYDVGLEVDVVVDGRTETHRFGTRAQPLRLTTISPSIVDAYDWDPRTRRWLRACDIAERYQGVAPCT